MAIIRSRWRVKSTLSPQPMRSKTWKSVSWPPARQPSGSRRKRKPSATDLPIQATELGKKFMDKHPKMVALHEQMAEVRKAVTGEVQRVIASLENQFNALVNQENELKQLFNTQKTSVIQSEKDVTAYESLRRDLDIQKAMHQEISKRLAETSITTALENNNVTIVEQALTGNSVPSGAIKYLLIGLIFSLGCGGGLTVLAEGLDRRFKNVAEV